MGKRSVLVSGGAGYIGSHAVRALLDAGYDVAVLDNLSTGHIAAVDPRARLYLGDVRDVAFLAAVMRENGFDGVMQFAAKIIVPESVEDPVAYWDDNIAGVNSLVRCMRAYGVKNIVFSSTAAVYGTKSEPVIGEDASLSPESPYGFSKLVSERLISYAESAWGLKHAVFRYFNVAGASPDSTIGEAHPLETHLIPVTVKAGLTGREMTLFGSDYETRDGTCLRDYIHVVDLVRAHVLGLEHLLDGGDSITVNLGSQNGYTNLEVIETVSRILKERGLSDGVPYSYGPRRAGDPAAIVASNRRAQEILGWKPEYDLAAMIGSDIDWRLSHEGLYGDVGRPVAAAGEGRKFYRPAPLSEDELVADGVFSPAEVDDRMKLREIGELDI